MIASIAGFPDHAASPAGLITALKNALVASKRSPGHDIRVANDYFD